MGLTVLGDIFAYVTGFGLGFFFFFFLRVGGGGGVNPTVEVVTFRLRG